MSMVEYPLVSIGIPTYNGQDSIQEAATSVLNQDYPRLDVIISDDCSWDGTQRLCLELIKNYPRVRYFRQQTNIGLTRNFEFVMNQATGDFFMWVAHDDSLEPGILKKYVEFLITHPEYSLVSGQIRYLRDNQNVFYEKGLSLESNSPTFRVTHYYSKVVQGAMYYGLTRRKTASMISLRNRIGDDWHYVANLAFLGKVKNLDCVGYAKKLNGTSKTFKQYAKVIGASWFAANFPRANIAVDAFEEILFLSPVYATLPVFRRLLLALSSSVCIFGKYYLKEFPVILGGRIKRYLLNGLSSRFLKILRFKSTQKGNAPPYRHNSPH